jgi:hypothetical protein
MTPDDTTRDVAARHTVESLYALKLETLKAMQSLTAKEVEVSILFQSVHGYTPYRIDSKLGYSCGSENREEKYFDLWAWKYLVDLFHLHRYMLCTEYEKLQKDIEEYQTPVFNPDNARAWLSTLQDLINDNIRVLIHQVFEEITQGTYHTGGYNGPTKKRNNNGIDASFILHTNDWSNLFGYWSNQPTITDDLEKVAYIIAGEPLPEKTAKEIMRDTKSDTYTGEYFSLKACKNGNSHFTLNEEIRQALNLYGPQGAIIGENIKIKVIDRWGKL